MMLCKPSQLALLGIALFGLEAAGAPTTADIGVRVIAHGRHGFALYKVPDMGRLENVKFIHITEPGQQIMPNVPPNSTLALRSVDMQFSAYIIVDLNPDEETSSGQPWKVCFMNPMAEGGSHFELKHSNAGYLWIPEGGYSCQITDHSHTFELRNQEHSPMAGFSIKNPNDEL